MVQQEPTEQTPPPSRLCFSRGRAGAEELDRDYHLLVSPLPCRGTWTPLSFSFCWKYLVHGRDGSGTNTFPEALLSCT